MPSARPIETVDLLEVCRRFLREDQPKDVMAWLAEHLDRETPYSREYLYALMRRASREGLITFAPPPEHALAHRIVTEFPNAEGRDVEVCQASTSIANATLPDVAARKIAKLIHRVDERKKARDGANARVHLGIGGGGTVRATCRSLVRRLQSEPSNVKLTVHTLSSAFDPKNPLVSPNAVLSQFENATDDVEYICLYAPAAWTEDERKHLAGNLGVVECIEAGREIDIVVTSLAAADDEHGELRRFFETNEGRSPDVRAWREALDAHGWVADVGYHPLSKDGPIEIDDLMKPVSVLDIGALIGMAADPDKHVVLVAGPCGACHRRKTEALRPLLKSPALRLWDHLVTSMDNVQTLFEDDPRRG